MIQLRELESTDWPPVKAIFEQGIATGTATFETGAPEWEAWDAGHLDGCRIVAEFEGQVVGWAALSPVSDRCAYGGVAEASVYVHSDHRRLGVGSALLDQLIRESEAAGIWTLQAGLFAENRGSLRLIGRHGFREVGVRRMLGKLDGTWRDVLLYERRSEVIGID